MEFKSISKEFVFWRKTKFFIFANTEAQFPKNTKKILFEGMKLFLLFTIFDSVLTLFQTMFWLYFRQCFDFILDNVLCWLYFRQCFDFILDNVLTLFLTVFWLYLDNILTLFLTVFWLYFRQCFDSVLEKCCVFLGQCFDFT